MGSDASVKHTLVFLFFPLVLFIHNNVTYGISVSYFCNSEKRSLKLLFIVHLLLVCILYCKSWSSMGHIFIIYLTPTLPKFSGGRFRAIFALFFFGRYERPPICWPNKSKLVYLLQQHLLEQKQLLKAFRLATPPSFHNTLCIYVGLTISPISPYTFPQLGRFHHTHSHN